MVRVRMRRALAVALLAGAVVGPTATAAADLVATPGAVDFGDRVVGWTEGYDQTVVLAAGADTNVGSIGTKAPFFVRHHDCGTRIAAGGKCMVWVGFNPTAVGPVQGSVQVAYGASGGMHLLEVPLTGTGVAPPAAPTGVAVKLDERTGYPVVSWSPSTAPSLTGYVVYAAKSGDPLDQLITLNAGGPTTYTRPMPAGIWDYAVATRVTAGVGLPSARVTIASAVYVPPSAPLDLAATVGPNARQVNLTWKPPADPGSPNQLEYHVHRAAGRSPSTSDWRYVTATKATSFVETPPTSSNVWSYTVTASTVVGRGGVTAPVVADVTPAATVPGVPQNVKVTAASGANTVTWTAPASNGGAGITGYRVYRYANGGSPFAFIPGTGLTYTDEPPVVRKTTYTYSVSAVNSLGEGPQSAPVAPSTTSGGGGKPRK